MTQHGEPPQNRVEDWAAVAGGEPLILIDGGVDVMVGIYEIRAGESFPAHYHRRTTETFIGLDGAVDLVCDGQIRLLTPGVTVGVPPGVTHALKNRSRRRAVIVFVKSPNDDSDRMFVEPHSTKENQTS